MLNKNYNPDILTCISNLSSDEVFTPPEIAKLVLDNLPKEIWEDENIKFLDPVSKTGVFLREITSRLIDGLERKIDELITENTHLRVKIAKMEERLIVTAKKRNQNKYKDEQD